MSGVRFTVTVDSRRCVSVQRLPDGRTCIHMRAGHSLIADEPADVVLERLRLADGKEREELTS